MNILITGANGFLGRHTVSRFRQRHPDHTIRAMVRPSTEIDHLGWNADSGIDVTRADLCDPASLTQALSGVDAVIHLAAMVRGSDEAIQKSTVEGTVNLLQAMDHQHVTRMVLCSSFSVYNYRKIPKEGLLTESSPLLAEPELRRRNGYAIAKTEQERRVRSWAEQSSAQLTVLRPGFVWSQQHKDQPFLASLGPLRAALGPHRYIPLTYVENCADAFAAVTLDKHSYGQTFNVVDKEDITPQQYAKDLLQKTDQNPWVVPIPYELGFGAAWIATRLQETVGHIRLPSILNTYRFEPRFKPYQVHKSKLTNQLGWEQPISYSEALQRPQ